ncbi:bile acid:sodium symporter [Pseudonocardia sulfidoxydans NBRC 16205]|uniref:Bile acid:sodium symporter n=1 Tax=Pseudonocardia sulfidoxydans NBRC 16205 TaxID=1223511 RepID=A0A511DGE1_9PSEU|nr:bile acid:sodium symporter family protein [Pseudonocardia sulfidoxydans]GEL23597.1 bile acid:sodium symporter [Pseudonocardia sulfidoxydans NBRC 16205]
MLDRLRRIRPDLFIVALLVVIGIAALLPARGVVATGFGHATTVAIGLLFFLYGARLSTREAIDGLRHWRLHGTVLAATYVLFPLLGLAVTLLPTSVLPRDLALGVVFLCCLPSTVQSSIAFTSLARGNVPAAICAASLSNLLGIVVTPLLAALLLSSHGGITGGAVLDVALQLLAPFVAGQLARRWIGGWVARHKKRLVVVDRGSILLVVYVAFSEGMAEGIWGRLSAGSLLILAGVCVVLLAAVLAITWFVPRRFPWADRVTIMFCGSKKSLATGLPMAGVLFAGDQVGLLVLPLMLFHMIQLMACAAIAARLSRRAEAPSGVAVPA